jgi:hypothetical protein
MRKVFVAVVCIMMFLFSGCSKEEELIVRNTLIINEDNTLTAVVVDVLDQEYYHADELKKFIEDEIYAYNYGVFKTALRLDSFEVAEENVIVSITYQTADDYIAFNGQKLYLGSILGAMEKGYLFDKQFLNQKGEAVSVAVATEMASNYVLITNEQTDIQFAKNILYMSGNAEMDGKKRAVAPTDEEVYFIY